MRILEALHLVPEAVHLRRTVRLDFLNARLLVNQLAALENRNQQFLSVNVVEGFLLPGRHRVEDGDGDRHGGVQLLVAAADVVCLRLAAVGVVEAVQALEARVGDFFEGLGNLDSWLIFAIIFNSNHLVHAAEHRVGLGGDEAFADAEAVDLCALTDQIADDILVQRVGRHDFYVAVTGVIQHFAGLFGQVSDVAAVDAHTLRTMSRRHHDFIKDLDGVRNTGLEDVVSVHQQRTVIRINAGIFLKGFQLGVEHLHPRVSHGAHCRNAVIAVGDGAGGGSAAADVGRSCAQNGRIVALCAAGTELHDGSALSGAHHAVCLGADQGLVVDGQQDHGLHQLTLDDRAADGQDRLVREHDGAFLHGPDVAGELEVCQIIQEALIEAALAAEILDVLLGKFQVIQVVDDLLQTGKNGEAAAVRNAAEEHIEHRHLVLQAVDEVAVGHGELIVVGEHGQISFVFPVDLHKGTLL